MPAATSPPPFSTVTVLAPAKGKRKARFAQGVAVPPTDVPGSPGIERQVPPLLAALARSWISASQLYANVPHALVPGTSAIVSQVLRRLTFPEPPTTRGFSSGRPSSIQWRHGRATLCRPWRRRPASYLTNRPTTFSGGAATVGCTPLFLRARSPQTASNRLMRQDEAPQTASQPIGLRRFEASWGVFWGGAPH